MSGQSIKVTTEDVRDLAGDCVKTGAAVVRELDALERRVTSVVNGTWVSRASGSFEGYFREFNQGQKKVEEALRGISQQLNRAASSYDQTEEGIAGSFRPGR
jgi:WXG100 family type VII secretion target